METHDNSMDPVRGPGTTNPNPSKSRWIGNMLNDSKEVYSGEDLARDEDHDLSAFDMSMDEGADAAAFLEPGDLVVLSS